MQRESKQLQPGTETQTPCWSGTYCIPTRALPPVNPSAPLQKALKTHPSPPLVLPETPYGERSPWKIDALTFKNYLQLAFTKSFCSSCVCASPDPKK